MDYITRIKKPVEVETSCRWCVSSHVCSRDMHQLCVNYHFATSEHAGTSCQSCINKYARYDPNDPQPCFCCLFWSKRIDARPAIKYEFCEVWSQPDRERPEDFWRIGYCKYEEKEAVEKLIRSDKDFMGGGDPDAIIEFIPITDAEYHRWADAEQPSCLSDFTKLLKKQKSS